MDLERPAGSGSRFGISRRSLPEVGATGILDLELETPTLDDDLDCPARG
jgi:hypothetical protein